jgi:hypothetical protein
MTGSIKIRVVEIEFFIVFVLSGQAHLIYAQVQ